MYVIYLLAKVFPVLAFMLAIVLFDLGRHFRRKKDKVQFAMFGTSGFLVLLAVVWLVFRGDVHAVSWVKQLFFVQ